MRRRTTVRSAVLAVAAAAIVTQAAWAQSAYEGFKLTFPFFNTGSGFTDAWNVGGFNAFAAGYTAAETSLAFSGLQTSPGRVVGHPFNQINGATRTLAQPLGADNTTTYVSFMLRPQGTIDEGVFSGFFGVTLNGSTGADLFVGKPGGGAVHDFVIEDRGGSGQLSTDIPAVAGQTAFFVLKAEFRAGNDIFTLYTNPAPGSPEPASGGVIKTDLNLGSVPRIGIYSTGAFEVDEIRIGASYAEVTPLVAFNGTPGAHNCHGQSVSGLSQAYKGLPAAASELGFASVQALQAAITAYCGN